MEQLGARPKEFSSASNEVPDLVMDTDDAKEVPTNEDPDHLPRESPPPYSEVDPLKKTIERPNSLDLSSETPVQESVTSPQENAQIDDDETTNEGNTNVIAAAVKTSFSNISSSICVLTLENFYAFVSHFNFFILAFSTNLWPIKTDMSGNTVWPQASGFQKLAKMDHFWHF